MENQTQIPVIQLEQQSKKSNFVILLLAILLFISLAITGFFAFQTQKLVKELTLLRTEPTPVATIEPMADPTANWKTYTTTKYTLRYPSEWIVDDKCTKLSFPNNDFCIFSPDYRPVTKKVDPGDGGSDTVTEYNIGTLLHISLIDNTEFKLDWFCKPGGPAIVDNCREKTINGNKYAIRELGSYPYPTSAIDAAFLLNDKRLVNLTLSFSKEKRTEDFQVFDQILSSFKFTN